MEYKHGDVDQHGWILCIEVNGDTFERSYWVDRGEIFVTREQAQNAIQHGWEIVGPVFGPSPYDMMRIRKA